MILVKVHLDFKLTLRTRHTPLLGGRSPHICVGNFNFFLGFLSVYVPCVCIFDVLRYRETLRFVVLARLLSMTRLFSFFVFLVGRSDAAELRTHRAAIILACTDAGVL